MRMKANSVRKFDESNPDSDALQQLEGYGLDVDQLQGCPPEALAYLAGWLDEMLGGLSDDDGVASADDVKQVAQFYEGNRAAMAKAGISKNSFVSTFCESGMSVNRFLEREPTKPQPGQFDDPNRGNATSGGGSGGDDDGGKKTVNRAEVQSLCDRFVRKFSNDLRKLGDTRTAAKMAEDVAAMQPRERDEQLKQMRELLK